MANIQIAGRLTRDAEVRYTPTGKVVVSFVIAENVYHNNEQQSQFFNGQLWGERGEKLSQYLTKGAPLTVFGTLIVRKYTDKQDVERQSLDINVQDVVFQGSANNQSGNPPPQPPQRKPTQQARLVDDIDSDIPF